MSESSTRPKNVPSYRRHKQSGQAIVTVVDGLGGRRDVLLGKHGTAASRAEYARVIAEWEASGRRIADAKSAAGDVTVVELIRDYWRFAQTHYRHPDGTATSEAECVRQSLKPLKALYGPTRGADFGPLALKAVRAQMIDAGQSLGVVNKNTGRIKRLFKWAAAEELLPAAVYHSLQCVSGIARGRGIVRETAPIKPVPDRFVEAVLPFVLPPVRAMIEVQRLTGARPGEVCMMRVADIDTTGATWLYRPVRHKTSWRGRERIIALGPRAQAIIREFLTTETQAYLFSPKRAMEWRATKLRADRKTPLWPSHTKRGRGQPSVKDHYSTLAYARAISRGCEKADVSHWHPNQLRHNHATEVRRRFGLEAAGAALGHSNLSATEIYAERDLRLAQRIASEVG